MARRPVTLLAAVALAAVALLATGCGQDAKGAADPGDRPAAGSVSATGTPSDLEEMRKVVDAAESAANAADSAAAQDD